jgi:cobalt/nickel transport system permease protein
VRPEFIDRFSRNDTPLQRTGAGLKCAVAVGLILFILLSPWTLTVVSVIIALLLAGVARIGRIPFGFLLRRIIATELFIGMLGVLILFQPDGATKFLTITIKSALSLATVLLLANTTPFPALLGVLQSIRVPSIVVTMLALMYRYIFILFDEMERMKRARASRTFNGAITHRWYSLSTILGQLFVRSTERAERIYAAMSARGWKTR